MNQIAFHRNKPPVFPSVFRLKRNAFVWRHPETSRIPLLILPRFRGVTTDGVLDSMIRFNDNIYSHNRQYSAIAILHTFQFIDAYALGFSVFISRILATDLYRLTGTSNHTWSLLVTVQFISCHYSWPNSIPRLPYSYPDRLASRNSTLHSVLLLLLLFCTRLGRVPKSKSKSHCDCRSVSQSWCRAPVWGSWPDIYYCLTVTVLILWGALFRERMGLSFVYTAGPCQRSLSRVRVVSFYNPWVRTTQRTASLLLRRLVYWSVV
jgi:hypothetical protein